MGTLPRSGYGASLVEDTDPSHHLRSEYLYPNGFIRVLPLSTHLFLCEPRILAIGLGERLGNTRPVRLLSVVPPVLGLLFCPVDLLLQLCRLFAAKFIQAGEVDG